MSEAKVSAARVSQSAQPGRAPSTPGRLAGRPPAGDAGPVVRKKRSSMRPIPVSRDAQRVATAILEVLAGVRTPTEAAAAVSLSLPRYYLWEQRALEGLVRACEPRPKGQVMGQRHQIAVLEKEVARLRQDCARQQALVRASQRTIGLAASGPPAAKPAVKPGAGTGAPACGSRSATAKAAGTVASKAKRKRRPVARALKAVAALQTSPGDDHDHEYMVPDLAPESLADSSSAIVTIAPDMVQRSVPSSSLATAEAAPVAGHDHDHDHGYMVPDMVPAVIET